jgi:hypothetical protein
LPNRFFKATLCIRKIGFKYMRNFQCFYNLGFSFDGRHEER